MIELYHGSNIEIENIDFHFCKPNKDFGKGFYLTDIFQQAVDMAKRRTSIVGSGSPTVTTFFFNENHLTDGTLNVLLFENPTREWAEFILSNRNSYKNAFHHNYDIVIGPVADDGVVFQLDRYLEGIITIDELVKQLTYRKLNRQYFFGTEKAINLLSRPTNTRP